jgi:hypothetical protein
LSHILFRSDSVAKTRFIVDYAKKVKVTVNKLKGKISEPGLRQVLSQLINIVEDHRCDKLWGRIYPGSYKLKKEMDREYVEPMVPMADASILVYFSCLEAGVDVPPCSNDRFRPYLLEALRKVEGRGFSATLIVSKWLVAMLVNEIIRESQGEDPPQDFPDESVVVVGIPALSDSGQPNDDDGDAGDGQGDGHDGTGDSDHTDAGGAGSEDGETQDADGSDSGGDPAAAQSAGTGAAGTPWEPPGVDATAQERSQALESLVGRMNPQKRPLDDDVQEPKFQSYKDKERTNRDVAEAVKAQVKDSQKMEGLLAKSAAEMQRIIDEANEAVRAALSEDDHLRKDAMARLVFRDVRKSDVNATPEPMSKEDLETVRRLRGIFNKIMGRRKTTLEDCGVEVDPSAYVEMKMTGIPVPCFRHEDRGRGFKAMILLDRSSSMHGRRTKKAERACRIIGKALRYPFVELHIWGFQSLENGQVDIARFDPQLEVFDSPKSNVRGVTPLHVAVRVGAKHLMVGSESKQLFAITDGWPIYARREGKAFSKRQLMFFVREDVKKARRNGINVTGVLIGHHEMSPAELAFMFGRRENWRIMGEQRFGHDLVQLVSQSFIHYLKTL